jgi:hypothetical protein
MGLAEEVAKKAKRLTVQVWIDNRRVYGVTGRIRYGFGSVVALCELNLRERPDWLRFNQTVSVSLGWNGLTRRRFTGFVEDDGRKVWPYSKTITAAGYMRWAERQSPEEVTYTNQTAQAIISDLLSRAGVPFRNVGGDNTTLATIEDIVLAKRQSYWDLIQQIDAPFLCRTFDWLPDGTVRRMTITDLPAAAAKWQYVYPGNVLELDNPLTVRTVKNRVEVVGLDGVEAYRRADSPYVDSQHDAIHPVQSDLIEDETVAAAVALLHMPTVNRLTRQVTIRVAGNPLLDPGDTINLTAEKVGIVNENLYLKEIDDAWDESSYYSLLTLEGGAGEAGYAVYPPIASFTLKATQETFDAGAGMESFITVLCDGSSSSSPVGNPLTFAWSNNTTADTATTETYSFRITAAQLAACEVTLTVSDGTETDTLILPVEFGAEDGVQTRDLYLAKETDAESTPDGGETWDSQGVAATVTPEIAGETHSYFGAGTALKRTDDHLATAPLDVHTFPAAITAIWIHEIDANNLMIGLADGTVWTTSNASAGAGATWAQLYSYGSPVNWVVWGYDGTKWVLVGNQVIANGAVQWQLDEGYTVKRLALSSVAHYAAGDNGSAAQVKRSDGVVIAWPVGYAPVRCGGLCHDILRDILYAADESGNCYTKQAGADVFTFTSTIGGGECYHLVRDGTNALILWAACENGLYKSYDSGRNWFLMRAGRTLMVGYGSAPWMQVAATTIVSDTDAKVLNLWTGSANATPPANWRDLTFDDSAWATATVVVEGSLADPPSGADPIWSTATPQSATQQTLVRRTFELSAGVVTSATFQVVADAGYHVWVNGVFIGEETDLPESGPLATYTLSPTILKPGETNCIAVWGKNGWPGTGTDYAWVGFKLVIA